MTETNGTRIVHEPDFNRYDIYVDGIRGGYVEYDVDADVITFTHTVTVPEMRGRGLAGRVVKRALDDARFAGSSVIPQCWYVAQYIDAHPEYADLLASPGPRSRPPKQ